MTRTGHAYYFDQPLPYAAVRDAQERLVRRRLAEEIPDTLLVLRHSPVITLGRRGRREHLLASEEFLRQAGVTLEMAPRGGDVTYHGPGQVVAYPIVKLAGPSGAAHGFLEVLETAAIETAKAFGVDAFHRDLMSGAWCAQGKLAAIGFRITQGVTSHGVALNLAAQDLAGFSLIHGCGLAGEPVTSLESALGRKPDPVEVARRLGDEIARSLGRTFRWMKPNDLDLLA
jgi:lipoyl(octanoyl) transferase